MRAVTLRYKGYSTDCEVSTEVEFGKEVEYAHCRITGLPDVIVSNGLVDIAGFGGRSRDGVGGLELVRRLFEEDVDIYLDWCAEQGIEPKRGVENV